MKRANLNPQASGKKISKILVMLAIAAFLFAITNCSSSGSDKAANTNDPMANKGIGPVKSVTVGALDNELAETGKSLFQSKCTACHKIETKVVGPALTGITNRRNPEWIMNMILNPTEMLQKDPVAKDLLATYAAQMANQNLTEYEARAVLEYFRAEDGKTKN